MSHGASGYTFSTHPTNLQILNSLSDSGRMKQAFDLYPVLPYAEGYVRLANEKGMSGLVSEFLSKLSLAEKAKAIFDGGFSAVRLDLVGMLKAYLDAELKAYLKAKPRNASLRAVLLHEVVTDLCLGLRQSEILSSFAQHIRERYHASPGFVTYNLAKLLEFLQGSGLSMEDVTIMAPFNCVGFQMSPSKEACEVCLSSIEQGRVIAMSIMAGGFLGLEQAVDYIRTLPRLSGIAVGVSSTDHARDTFLKLKGLD